MKRPTVALAGIGGVYNYGCEAIVRGTHAIIHSAIPDARVVYISPRPREDRRALSGLDMVVRGRRPGWIPGKRLANLVLRSLHSPRRFDWSANAWIKSAACVLSIGGDLLTLPPGGGTTRVFASMEQSVMDLGIPLVLWGASVGPFDENLAAKAYYTALLRRMNLITVRERVTLNYLESLGVSTNTRLVADPAFLMDVQAGARNQPTPPRRSGRAVIAVNLSPLSVRLALGESRAADAQAAQAEAVARLIQQQDVNILLVPHVVCGWKPVDDDVAYLRGVFNHLPGALRSRVKLVRPGLGAQNTKRLIATCDALVAARMHCGIAGMSVGVPTLLLAYSPKAIGMCEYVYGSRDFVLGLDAGSDEWSLRLSELLNPSRGCRSYLVERMKEVRADALRAGEHLAEVLS